MDKDQMRKYSENPIYALILSNFLAQAAEQVSLAVVPLVAVLALHLGAPDTALLLTAQTLPFLLLALPAGILVDSIDRKSLVIASEMLRAASLLAILICSMYGYLSVHLLAVLGFLGAVGTVTYSVATPSLVPSLVAKESLPIANGRIELGRSAAFAMAPAVAGYAVSSWGESIAFAIPLSLSLFAIASLSAIGSPGRMAASNAGILRRVAFGFSFVVRSEELRSMLFTSIVFNLSWFLLLSIYTPYAVYDLRFSGSEVGMTLGFCGVGMLVGATAFRWILKRIAFGKMLIIGPASAFLGSLLILSTIFNKSLIAVCAAFFLFGVGPVIWAIASGTLRQVLTPHENLGSVSALILVATYGTRPLGASIGGVISARFGIEPGIYLVALGFLIQLIIICSSKVKNLQTADKQSPPSPSSSIFLRFPSVFLPSSFLPKEDEEKERER
jgi:predicted MFS family arabinose efflux permease